MLNEVCLQGRLTKDPDFRTTQSGIPVARFNVAVDRGYGDKKQTAFIPCTAWRGTAEFINNYFTKGQMIVLKGHLTTGSYEGKNGKVYTMDVVAEEVSFCGSKMESSGEEFITPKFEDLDDSDGDLPF